MHMRIFSFLVLLLPAALAHAQATPSDSLTADIIAAAVGEMTPVISGKGMQLLAFMMMLQWVISHWQQLLSSISGGDLGSVAGKSLALIIWGGVCLWLMEAGPEFLRTVGNHLFVEFGGYFPSIATIFLTTINASSGLIVAAIMIGQVNTTAGFAILSITAVVAMSGIGLAAKVLLLKVELILNVAMAPLSFAFLPLSALRDQGLAPFRALISLMYRLIIYAVLCSAFIEISGVTMKMMKQLSTSDLLTALTSGYELFKLLLAAAVAYGVLFMMLFRSDQIASNLASGSTSLNTSDLAAAAMTASVAAGMAGGIGARATGGVQSMSDMMKGLLSSPKVGMNNASTEGQGELPSAVAKPDSSSGNMSVADGANDGGGGPVPSAQGESASLPPNPNEFRGVPNPLPSQKAKAERATERAARREAGRSSGQEAGIGGNTSPTASPLRTGGNFERLAHELERGKSATHVSMTARGD